MGLRSGGVVMLAQLTYVVGSHHVGPVDLRRGGSPCWPNWRPSWGVVMMAQLTYVVGGHHGGLIDVRRGVCTMSAQLAYVVGVVMLAQLIYVVGSKLVQRYICTRWVQDNL